MAMTSLLPEIRRLLSVLCSQQPRRSLARPFMCFSSPHQRHHDALHLLISLQQWTSRPPLSPRSSAFSSTIAHPFAAVPARSNRRPLNGNTKALQELYRVVRLPGQPSVGFQHYAGYFTVDESRGKALFYWFFEAAHRPADKPIILWLNGGPGCSSIGFGEAQEIGPFHVEKDVAELVLKNYSWNKAANLLFLDAPAGVSFSYSNTTLDVHAQGDDATALSSYEFLVNWLRRSPQYKSNEFYVAGESYGAYYVPQLANVIIDENKKVAKENYINLKGFMIGNPLIDDETDSNGMIDYAWDHAVISDKVYQSIKKKRNFSEAVQSHECNRALHPYYDLYNIIDMYSLYTPRCEKGYPALATSMTGQISDNPDFVPRYENLLMIRAGYDLCLQTYVTEYFNRADVQEALHANVTKLSNPWSLCSGDTDGRVPVTSTRYTLKKLGLNIREDWTPWYNRKQVGGWTIIYEGLTFITIRGSGHEVPMIAPKRALQILEHFLSNEKLPSTPF